jgi:hypothetical protein
MRYLGNLRLYLLVVLLGGLFALLVELASRGSSL